MSLSYTCKPFKILISSNLNYEKLCPLISNVNMQLYIFATNVKLNFNYTCKFSTFKFARDMQVI